MVTVSDLYDTPLDAEAAFYEAFESKDVDAMMSVWANSSDVVCIHPMGPNLSGSDSVRDSWQTLFDNGPNLTFNVDTIQYVEDDNTAVHVVRQNITVNDDAHNMPVIIATNVYRKSDDGWQMVLHHSSPGPGSGMEQEELEPDNESSITLH
jgi:uncharacterized protein (TIGR02246 family)